MGCFSFKFADVKGALKYGRSAYLLLPAHLADEFGRKSIYESSYGLYGDFGGFDVYEVLAYANKDFIIKVFDEASVKHFKGISSAAKRRYSQKCLSASEIEAKDMEEKARNLKRFFAFKAYKEKLKNAKSFSDVESEAWLREIGIELFFSAKRVPFPLRISQGDVLYEDCSRSSRDDPLQGLW